MNINWEKIYLYSAAVAVTIFAAAAAMANAVMAISVGAVVMTTLGPRLGLVTGFWLMLVGAVAQSVLTKKLREFLFRAYLDQAGKTRDQVEKK